MMISCIIPTYNNLELFKRALNSILKQEDIEKEIIVVDDSTSSEIEDYCRNLGNGIVYRHNIPSLGAVKNWNYGLSLATGDSLLLIHHDEELKSPDCLRKIEETFKKGYDVIVSNIEVHKPNSIRKGLCPDCVKKLFIAFPQLLFIRNFIGPCACVAFKKEKKELFDENLKWLVDIEWYYRLLRNSKSKMLTNNWVISNHGHAGQITLNLNVKAQAMEDRTYLRQKYSRNIAIRFCLSISNIFKCKTVKSLLKAIFIHQK